MIVVSLLKTPLRAARAVARAVQGKPQGPVREPPIPVVPPRELPSPEVAPAPKGPPVEVRVEETPNPNARRFTTNRQVVASGSLVFNRADDASEHPFAAALFEIPGVFTVFATGNFVTVTRRDGAPWAQLSPAVVEALSKALA